MVKKRPEINEIREQLIKAKYFDQLSEFISEISVDENEPKQNRFGGSLLPPKTLEVPQVTEKALALTRVCQLKTPPDAQS